MSKLSLDHRVLDSVLAEHLNAPQWFVGFSGGVDSTVLLHLLQRWCQHHNAAPALSAFHVNHGIQATADEWQAHCQRVCDACEIPLLVQTVTVDAHGSMEAAARKARYAAFSEHLPPDAILFLGHHRDDQVETFLLRLLRGAGVDGLAGMPASRALGTGVLQRPLLDVDRVDIEGYAQRHELTYIDDPSNVDTAMDRNYLRAQVLPLLEARWPGYRRTVTRASSHLSAAAITLREVVGVPETVYSRMGDPGVSAADLNSSNAAQGLRAWLQTQGCSAPAQSILTEFLRQLRESDAAARPRLDCGSYQLQRHRSVIYLLPYMPDPAPTEILNLRAGESLTVPGVGDIALRPSSGEGLHIEVGEVVQLSWQSRGEANEQCRIAGRAGSKTLKKLLQEAGVPPWWRNRVPLVKLGSESLAIGDLALCASSRWRSSAGANDPLWRIHWTRPESRSGD